MESTERKAPDTANIRGGSKFNDLKPNYSKPKAGNTPARHEVFTNFRQAVIENIGHAPDKIYASGKLERFSSSGKRGDLSGWYVLFINGDHAAGAFGCWRSGIKQTWTSAGASHCLTQQEWADIRKAIAVSRQQAEQQRQAKAAQAHHNAVRLWLASSPADPTHPYLQRKRVGLHGIRQTGDKLLIPVCDLDGVLHGAQTIAPDGSKRFLSGTPKRGLFCLIGQQLTHPRGVYLCEGYATGASLHDYYSLPVLSCFDAGNLLPVAQAYRKRFPLTPMTICTDNDRDPGSTGYQVGIRKAREVCAALPGVGLIVPEFPTGTPLNLSDFNDLVSLLGSSENKEHTL